MGHLLHFVVGFGLLLHALYWGAGAAMFAMPRPWRRFWPVLWIPMGWALQAAVVWFAVRVGLRGTNSYAWAVEAIPLILLVLALRKFGIRASWVNISRFGVLASLVGGCLLLLILPLAIASNGLTTISLSSCDAGDYGAGARLLMEFARTDREGFIGLTEVVRVASVDNFFDYWLRLNHFTPAALLALNGSILQCAPHELVSLFSMVLVAGSLPLVFWVARAMFGYAGGVSLLVALLYGLSPVTWYAAMQAAPGQLIAAQAIALLTWAGVALWRGRLTWQRGAQFAVVLATAYWLILGSYNFILLICWVPAVCFALGATVWRGTWSRFLRWLAVLLAPLAVGGLFYDRLAGLAERFALLRAHDFGWRIAALTPEGWLGMVSGPDLEAWNFFGLRWALTALVLVPLAWACWRAIRAGRSGVWLVGSTVLPVLAGYYFLQWRGVAFGTNASYDAYKLFAVFLPLILPAACWWVTLRRSWRLTEWFGVVGLSAVIVTLNLVAVGMFVWRMARPPLVVDAPLRNLRRIEAMPEVKSVNVLLDHMWERLWANAFLLRKPQYFLTTSYEGRWQTPLRGEWDLRSGLIRVRSAVPGSERVINHRYRLEPRVGPHALQVEFGTSWNGLEALALTGEQWRWSREEFGELVVENPHPTPLRVNLTLDARAIEPRQMEAIVGARLSVVRSPVSAERGRVRFEGLIIPPGRHSLRLDIGTGPATMPVYGRSLGICVWGVDVEVQEK